jgi:hypothetical protein
MNVPALARRRNGQLIGGRGSLNPAGRPRISIGQLRETYAHKLPILFDRLFWIATHATSERVQIAAISELLDRLLGKPQVTIEATHTSVSVAELYKAAMLKASRANSVPSEQMVEGKANETDGDNLINGHADRAGAARD